MTPTPQQITHAFAIADKAMFEVLLSEGVPIDAPPSDATAIAFTDEACQEVSSLEQASAVMREAFEWLKLRGYVGLCNDDDGDYVLVLRKPGEASVEPVRDFAHAIRPSKPWPRTAGVIVDRGGER